MRIIRFKQKRDIGTNQEGEQSVNDVQSGTDDPASILAVQSSTPLNVPSGNEVQSSKADELLSGNENEVPSGTTQAVQSDIQVQSGTENEVPVPLQSGTTQAVQSDIQVQSSTENEVPVPLQSGTTEVVQSDIQVQSGTENEVPVPLQSGTTQAVQSDIQVQSGTENEVPVPLKSGTTQAVQSDIQVQSGTEHKVPSGKENKVPLPSGTTPTVLSDNVLPAGNKCDNSGLLCSYMREDENAVNTDVQTEPLPKKAKKGWTTRNSQKAGQIEILETKRSRPESLKELDPIGEALGDTSPLRSNDERTEHHTDSGHDSPSSKEIKTEQGKLKITDYAICRGGKKRKINLKCPVAECGQRFPSEKSRNDHIRTDHPDKQFTCTECGKNYSTANRLWKHYNKHFAPKFSCDWENCKWKFHFRNELVNHMKTHTGEGKIPCTWKGCRREFVSTKNMYSHLESHTDTKFPCSQCPKQFETKYLYQQHFIGQHTDAKGFKAKCGEGFKWPEDRSKHQENCEKCLGIFEKLETRPSKPVKKRKSDDPPEEEPKDE